VVKSRTGREAEITGKNTEPKGSVSLTMTRIWEHVTNEPRHMGIKVRRSTPRKISHLADQKWSGWLLGVAEKNNRKGNGKAGQSYV